MPATATVNVKLLDAPQIQAALVEAAERLAKAVRERDELAEQYAQYRRESMEHLDTVTRRLHAAEDRAATA